MSNHKLPTTHIIKNIEDNRVIRKSKVDETVGLVPTPKTMTFNTKSP
jgi:hypothetical protein